MRRVLGWLRLSGDPVVEQSAPDPSHAAVFEARELEIAKIDQAIRWEFERGDEVAINALLDERNALRKARPRVRPSAPTIPGRPS
jgi:hypothetical protein